MVGPSARTNCKSTIKTTDNKTTVIVASWYEYLFVPGGLDAVVQLYAMVQDKVTAYSNWIMPFFFEQST